MSPSRRDLLKFVTGAAIAAAIPAIPAVSQTPSLASMCDLTERVPYVMAPLGYFLAEHWVHRWSVAERAHFLDVFEREFPEIADDIVGALQRRAADSEGWAS